MLYIKLFIEREKIQVNQRRSVPLRGQGVKGLRIALDRQLPYRTVFGRGRAGM